jgi:uncharacterized protein (TIGR02145 family)
MKIFHLTFSFLFILVIFVSCHKDSTPPLTYTGQGNIGKEGGIVKSEDGAFVEIPAGALNSNKTISMNNTTEGDTIINTGCKIYELKPDGLIFSDSVVITLPFDDQYIDLSNRQKDYGVGIMVYQDNKWIKLKTVIDINKKRINAKIIHFSTYVVYYPYKWTVYFLNNKDINSPPVLNVPYYYQGDLNWCAYYSLSMVTKYAGYNYKAPYFAALFNESPSTGLHWIELPELDRKLVSNNIATEIAFPAWGNPKELSGYILKCINDGLPVWVGSRTRQHAFVVIGHDVTGFYINDPSGAFLSYFTDNLLITKLATTHVTYEEFIDKLVNFWDYVGSIFGAENTLVITSSVNTQNKGFSINFPVGYSKLEVLDSDNKLKGEILIDGNYQPNGYSLVNSTSKDNVFNGTDKMKIYPVVANNNLNSQSANLHYKIDNKDVIGSPILLSDVSGGLSYYLPKTITFKLSNLSKGNHYLSIELRSLSNPNDIYDYWDFLFKIDNEFIDTPTTITDIDGNVYNTVNIGTQVWMAENLKTTRYNDNSIIPLVTDEVEWAALITPGYCWYNNDETTNRDLYGALYNWHAINTQKLCPTGWHVPSNTEWTYMENYLISNGYNYDGTTTGNKIAKSMAATNRWMAYSTAGTIGNDQESNNRSGFTALPGGSRYFNGQFFNIGMLGAWWTSTESYPNGHWDRSLYYAYDYLNNEIDNYWKIACSVRCIKDN